ncbi:MAG TPA: hypothetical protein VLH09_09365 [Bryobacteraceae bacterium]|nr:hypothetical protein [Bryobacteraceae bacterium]
MARRRPRAAVDDLMRQDYFGIQRGTAGPDTREAITQLGLDYRLMTQFTSFVAVEETTVTAGGQPRRIEVPVELPEGVSCEGVFGGERRQSKLLLPAVTAQAAPMGALRVSQALTFRETDAAVAA